jgi:hypothetical protein
MQKKYAVVKREVRKTKCERWVKYFNDTERGLHATRSTALERSKHLNKSAAGSLK